MTRIAYRNDRNGLNGPFIPYEIQEFVAADVHRHCSPQRAARLIPVCFDALERYVRGDLLAVLQLPEGCSIDGTVTAPVWLLVEELGLDLFANEVRFANNLPLPGDVPLVYLIPEELKVQ